jgi:hypothetical protein
VFNTTDCDLRYAAHTERVASIDRTGWRQTTTVPTRSRLAWVGELIARAGQRRGTTRRPEVVTTVPAGRSLS